MIEGGLQIQGAVAGSAERQTSELFCHLAAVHAYVARRIGPFSVAEDITSEVFGLALGSKLPKGDPLPWLYGIARRRIADAYRRRASRKEVPLDGAEQASPSPTHDALVQTDAARQLRALVDGLESDQREAILLFYVEDLSAKQVGRAMGRSEHAVNSLLQRARQKLRESGRDYFLEEDTP